MTIITMAIKASPLDPIAKTSIDMAQSFDVTLQPEPACSQLVQKS
jgi:hypothetical protein